MPNNHSHWLDQINMAADMISYDSLWLGIDLGTTSVKVVIVDNDGNVIQSSSCPTAAEVESTAGSLGYEQDPHKILATVDDLVCPIMLKFKDCIKGIGVTGQMHGVLMWRQCPNSYSNVCSLRDLGHVYVSNLYTWQDQRCTPAFIDTLPRASNSQQPLSTGHGCVTMFWLSQNQANFFQDGQFTSCGTIMDFLVSVLCGLDHPVTSDQLAASLGFFNTTNLSWDSVLFEDQDFPHKLLPKIVPAGSCVGHVTSSLTEWSRGVPVYVGLGDVQCAMYASLKNSHDAAINISTSIQLGFIIPAESSRQVRQESPPSISFFPYFDGRLLALCAGLNGGNAISHFVECVAQWVADLGFIDSCDTATLMNRLQQLAEESKDDPSSLTVRPVFFGERHDTDLCGHIGGIDATNFRSIGTIFRAVCEGIIDHLQDMVPVKYLRSRGISHLLVSGSVPVNNPLVMRHLIDVYTADVGLNIVTDDDNIQAVGSAVGAAQVIREYAKTC